MPAVILRRMIDTVKEVSKGCFANPSRLNSSEIFQTRVKLATRVPAAFYSAITSVCWRPFPRRSRITLDSSSTRANKGSSLSHLSLPGFFSALRADRRIFRDSVKLKPRREIESRGKPRDAVILVAFPRDGRRATTQRSQSINRDRRKRTTDALKHRACPDG